MSVTIHAAADLVDAATLQTLLQNLTGQFRYMILSSPQDRAFQRFNLLQAQDLQTWPDGQAFGPSSELRWRPKCGKFAVCFVTESDALPPSVAEMKEKETLDGKSEELEVRLWGEHTGDDVDPAGRPVWFEAQIPRLLAYPIEKDPPPAIVALRVRRYHRADETIAFVRFVGWEVEHA